MENLTGKIVKNYRFSIACPCGKSFRMAGFSVVADNKSKAKEYTRHWFPSPENKINFLSMEFRQQFDGYSFPLEKING